MLRERSLEMRLDVDLGPFRLRAGENFYQRLEEVLCEYMHAICVEYPLDGPALRWGDDPDVPIMLTEAPF
jgi:hypothetical protein